MNAADEIAMSAYHQRRIGFIGIPAMVGGCDEAPSPNSQTRFERRLGGRERGEECSDETCSQIALRVLTARRKTKRQNGGG